MPEPTDSLRNHGVAQTPTRTVFLDMAHWEVAFFYILSAVSTGVFIWGCYRLFRRYRLARIGGRRPHVGRALRIILPPPRSGRRTGPGWLAPPFFFYRVGVFVSGN